MRPIWERLLKPFTDLVTDVLDRTLPEKLTEMERAQLKLAASQQAADILQAQEDSFRAFVVDYEGKALDMPRSIQVLRGSVRPVLTYALALAWLATFIALFFETSAQYSPEQLKLITEGQSMLFKLNVVSLGFWYGERLISRTGLVTLFRSPKPEDDAA